jgi:hypothetical protein
MSERGTEQETQSHEKQRTHTLQLRPLASAPAAFHERLFKKKNKNQNKATTNMNGKYKWQNFMLTRWQT